MIHKDVSPRTFKWSMLAIGIGMVACLVGLHIASSRLRPAMVGVSVATAKWR